MTLIDKLILDIFFYFLNDKSHLVHRIEHIDTYDLLLCTFMNMIIIYKSLIFIDPLINLISFAFNFDLN